MELTVDKNNYILSKRYANALIGLANSDDLLEKFYDDLIKILEMYQNNKSFKEAINLPVVEKNRKKEIIENILKGKINETVIKFLYVLIDSNRFDMLETITYCFKEESDKIKNILNAKVVSAIDFKDDMKIALKEKLERKTGKQINIEYLKDESLIAGFILSLGERVVDLSIKNKIKQMNKQLN